MLFVILLCIAGARAASAAAPLPVRAASPASTDPTITTTSYYLDQGEAQLQHHHLDIGSAADLGLTSDDLRELGVTNVLSRVAVLKAMHQLRPEKPLITVCRSFIASRFGSRNACCLSQQTALLPADLSW
jgi:hypothetical protein